MENKKTPINIDGNEYQYEDMTAEQQTIVNHLVDLDRKLNSARFNVDQLQIGHNAFMTMLTESLSKQDDLVEST
jgi:hypothetical protein